ncbi:aromatic-ring-hydroxylating dioxygenase subunit beta [Streptomyces marispadix]|uniref:Aromatic-ring-hydroxylating dioxygenase subunit beta n=1 Tax=Streptomyces marispadix TaxID=2922868 RepID=A0ABS9T5L5_9ACTN|nr:aromatic-ring-hydroxylating dioxygenase subunit beta [Streptomyces marispadix]MCH6163850.1 aromatic-ring-hydroxylating dioxygenase subunit beta [Streptomyces marispadix]
MSMPESPSTFSRGDAEDWLYHEAELLDQWRLHDWLDLFTDDATYHVPDGIDDSPAPVRAALINDDRVRLEERVWRLVTGPAHAQIPRSTTRRLISNVRVAGAEDDVLVTSNFLVHEIRKGQERSFVGQYRHRLSPAPDGWKVAARTALLQNSVLPLFNVSIII